MLFTYYFLKAFAEELQAFLPQYIFHSAYTQQKDELYLAFFKEEKEFFLQVNLQPQHAFIAYEQEQARKKSNTTNLFDLLERKELKSVSPTPFDRSFQLHFEGGWILLFKMHGRGANVLLLKGNEIKERFRSHLDTKSTIDLNSLSNPPHQASQNDFEQENPTLQSINPLLPKKLRQHLEGQLQQAGSAGQKLRLYQQAIAQLEKDRHYKIVATDQHQVLIWPGSWTQPYQELEDVESALAASERYKYYLFSHQLFHQKKSALLQEKQKEEEGLEIGIKRLRGEQARLLHGPQASELADSIMANLHQLKPGTQCELINIHRNEPFRLELKSDETPQDRANKLYKKQKQQTKKEDSIAQQIWELEQSKHQKEAERQAIEQTQHLRELNKWEKNKKKAESNAQQKRFKTYKVKGFTILVGRNAKNNDELTLKEAKKDDYWLHAKDVAGSHVVIKHQAGQSLPEVVKEKAAALAAYYSKLKKDTVVPVQFTQKKYVRKKKGLPAGAVMVERESVLMADPDDRPKG